jgi:hypothetical protein
MGCESDHLGNNMGSRRFTFQKLKGGSTPKNPIPSARRLRRASKIHSILPQGGVMVDWDGDDNFAQEVIRLRAELADALCLCDERLNALDDLSAAHNALRVELTEAQDEIIALRSRELYLTNERGKIGED